MGKQKGSGRPKKKDICLWVVDAKSNVRKYRLSYLKVSLFAAFFTFLGALIFFVAGDYTRIQILRVKNYVLLQQLERERNALEETNQQLSGEVSNLKELNTKVLAYEQEVKSRLFEISKVIQSATTLDVLAESEDSEVAMPLEEEGVGGAELDCTVAGQGGERCHVSSWSDVGLRGRLDPVLISSPQQIALLRGLQKQAYLPQEALPDKLDKFLSLIKQIPMGNPAVGKITSGFGKRISPFTRNLSIHEGIDISLNSGTEILAAGSGRVVAAEKHPTYGLMVELRHNARLHTRYAHLNKLLVKKGQSVSSGQLVGLSGSTGRSTGPHLHYEVLVDGLAVNPKSFLSLRDNLRKIL